MQSVSGAGSHWNITYILTPVVGKPVAAEGINVLALNNNLPDVGLAIPPIIDSRVVLPEPEWPITEQNRLY